MSYDTLDAIDREQNKLTIITKFRGSGKTTELATWAAKKIAKNRDTRGIVISVDDEKATEIVDMTRKFLEQPQIVEWFTPFESRRLWSMDAFEVLGRTRPFREPTMTAAGIRSFRPGGHYNWVIIDDAEDDEWSNSAEKMIATQKRLSLLWPMIDVEEAIALYSATFWNDMDLTMSLLRSYGLLHEERQSDGSTRRVIRNGERVLHPLPDGSFYPVQVFYKPVEDDLGTPLFPQDRDASWIAAKKMEMRLQPDMYAAQYRLDPMPTENAKFRPEDFRFLDEFPKDLRGDVWITLDAASSLKPGSDHTAITVSTVTEAFDWYIHEAYSRQMDGRELVEEFFILDRAWPGARFAVEEDRYMAGIKIMLEEEMIRRKRVLDIQWINAHARTKKESRVDALQPLFRMGKVYFLTGRCDPLFDALRRWPKGRRDLPDSLANGYELAQSAAPARRDESPVDDHFMDVYRPRHRALPNETDPFEVPQRIRRMPADQVPWRML